MLFEVVSATATCGGLAMIGVRGARQERLRAESVWYGLTLPRGLETDAVSSALRALTGLAPRRTGLVLGLAALVVETRVDDGVISHRLGIATPWEQFVLAQFHGMIPGARLDSDPVRAPVALGAELRIRTSQTARATAPEAAAAGVLSTLGSLPGHAVVQWLLTPVPPPLRVGQHPREPQRLQQTEALIAAAVRVGAPDPSSLAGLVAAIRAAAPANACVARRAVPPQLVAGRIERASLPLVRWPCLLTAAELAGAVGFPLGSVVLPGLSTSGARVLPPSPALPTAGRVLGVATGTRHRPIALPHHDAMRHLYVVGPSGVGKSTLLLRCLIGDLQADHGLVCIDPKGDLVADVLRCIPSHRRDDVILLDPTDAERPVGFNVLAGSERNPDLVVDQVVGALRRLFSAPYWGPRLEDILRAALGTLVGVPGMTLCEAPVLLTNPAFRRRLTANIDDPIALGPFWESFEGLSDSARAAWIAPVQNKLRAVLGRRAIRNVVGQPDGLDMAHVLAERKVLVVSLAKGLLGEDAAALLGSLLLTSLWQTLQGRAALASHERLPVYVYLDEFQDYLATPVSLADALAQARGYRVGFVLAHQFVGQLPAEIRDAVLGTVASKVMFQTGAADARTLARELAPFVAPEDLQSLPAFHAYAHLSVDTAVLPPASLTTLPPPEPTSDPAEIRESSRRRYGTPVAEVEAGIRSRHQASGELPALGRRRRR